MIAEHLEILVEEPSMAAFLTEILPKLLNRRATFIIHVHQGKHDLLGKLDARLRGYAKWLPEFCRIVVLVDRDNDDCGALKRKIEQGAAAAGLLTRTVCGDARWRLVSRLAIEELEAWFFGEWEAVRKAYPRVSSSIPNQIAYRAPDGISGGTWEAFERVLKSFGYFPSGLRKLEAATAIGRQFDSTICRSPSFAAFGAALAEAVS